MAKFDTSKARYVDIIFPWDDEMCQVLPEDSDCDDENVSAQTPLVHSGYWHGVLDLKEHCILDFVPSFWLMSIQAKVRDGGIYTLLDDSKYPICCYRGYVPEFPFDENMAFGDYLHLFFGQDGKIQNWDKEFSDKEFQTNGKPISEAEFEQMKKFYLSSNESDSVAEENALMVLAAQLMLSAHSGQVDKAGHPYFWHPMRVAMKCETPEQKIVALLHDVLEDTEATPEYLLEKGFTKEIVDAVVSVTRREDETYEEFVIRCSLNTIGRQVKIHDLEDNLNVTRLHQLNDSDTSRINRYLKALRFLKGRD